MTRSAFWKNSGLLITGGTGSFGSKFVESILNDHPEVRSIVIYSRDEIKQFETSQRFLTERYPQIRYFFGDVRDKDRLYRALEEIDIVIHTAVGAAEDEVILDKGRPEGDTGDLADSGVDAAFSLEPEETRELVVETERAWKALGAVRYGPLEEEQKSRVFRRSLYVAEDMKAGEVFTKRNLRALRPRKGLSPKYYEVILGKRVKSDTPKGTPVRWDLID